MALTYKHTKYASYIGYVTQAIINNLTPLLFVTFQKQFDISLERIGLLIVINFGVQIIVDLLAANYADRIGYRNCTVAAHILCTLGLIGLGVFPLILPNAYAGLLLATVINAIGGGLIEVLISPIVEALPGDEKASAMSLLHSFYCWGHVGVVMLSTVFFSFAGVGNWVYLVLAWAAVPLLNAFFFSKVPIKTLVEQGEEVPLKKLFRVKIFWLFFILMICAGASEQAMSQWASLFAELGLNVSKTVGDLLGLCSFAALMGISRTIYGIYGERMHMKKAIIASSILCVLSYITAIFSPVPLLSLIGCAVCGFSVGILWPGIYSLSAAYYPKGGTAMFAILALAGDFGCSSGPGIVGIVSDSISKANTGFLNGIISGGSITEIGLKYGLLAVIIFPAILIFCVSLLRQKQNKKEYVTILSTEVQ